MTAKKYPKRVLFFYIFSLQLLAGIFALYLPLTMTIQFVYLFFNYFRAVLSPYFNLVYGRVKLFYFCVLSAFLSHRKQIKKNDC